MVYLSKVMSESTPLLVTIVLPLYNEQDGLIGFHNSLTEELAKIKSNIFEIIYCNDGSRDNSLEQLKSISHKDNRVRIITLSRNFGKEIATTAGIQLARGAAVITLDSDGQHPVELISQFIEEWNQGNKVVIGLRDSTAHTGIFKRISSNIFYGIFNRFTGIKLVQGATDFRLIDASVQKDFVKLTERNRITRGLIDWLGYQRTYIKFTAKPRLNDKAAYSYKKLSKLAVDSLISLSNSPLYATAYIGAVVLPLSLLLGITMIIDKLLGDPFKWHASGGAYVLVFMLCLVGILLMSQGFIGLYLTHIHSETQNRPLYIIDDDSSIGL